MMDNELTEERKENIRKIERGTITYDGAFCQINAAILDLGELYLARKMESYKFCSLLQAAADAGRIHLDSKSF